MHACMQYRKLFSKSQLFCTYYLYYPLNSPHPHCLSSLLQHSESDAVSMNSPIPCHHPESSGEVSHVLKTEDFMMHLPPFPYEQPYSGHFCFDPSQQPEGINVTGLMRLMPFVSVERGAGLSRYWGRRVERYCSTQFNTFRLARGANLSCRYACK